MSRFQNSLMRKPLVLFLGAGVNSGLLNDPSWNGLLENALRYCLNNLEINCNWTTEKRKNISDRLLNNKDFSVYHLASIIKQQLGGKYIPVVQNALYKKYLELQANNNWYLNFINKNAKFINSITDLCMHPTEKINHVSAIVTYNYDDFITRILKMKSKDKEVMNAVTRKHFKKMSRDVLTIYHIHGYIPPPNDFVNTAETPSIVLSYDEYFQNMLDPYSWQTTTQLSFLRNYTCLFLGTSLTDWNMLRAISTVTNCTPDYDIYALFLSETEEINKVMFNLKMSVLKDFGVFPIVVSDENNEDKKKYSLLYDFFENEIINMSV